MRHGTWLAHRANGRAPGQVASGEAEEPLSLGDREQGGSAGPWLRAVNDPEEGTPASRPSRYSPEARRALQAIRDYQIRHGRAFPSWEEIVEILRNLGLENPA